MQTKLAGNHNVLNIIGCISVVRYFDIDFCDILLSVKRISPVPHRLEIKGTKEFTILDDAFNSNPGGAAAALSVLSGFEGYKILITPGMVELGKLEYECNMKFGIQAANVCDIVLLVGRKVSKAIEDGLISANFKNYRVFDSFTSAFDYAKTADSYGKDKVVLIENDLPDNY